MNQKQKVLLIKTELIEFEKEFKRKKYVDEMKNEAKVFETNFNSFFMELIKRMSQNQPKKKKLIIPKLVFNKKLINVDQRVRYPQKQIMINFQRLQFDLLLIHNRNYDQTIFKNENFNNKSVLEIYYCINELNKDRRLIIQLLNSIIESFNFENVYSYLGFRIRELIF